MEGSQGAASASKKRKISTSRSTSAYPRKRAVKACKVCRTRRTKCDNNRPTCSFCASINTMCVWDDDDLSSFDPASLAIIDKISTMDTAIRSLTSSINAAASQMVLQQQLSTHIATTDSYLEASDSAYDSLTEQYDVARLSPQKIERVWLWRAFHGLSPPTPDALSTRDRGLPARDVERSPGIIQSPSTIDCSLDLSTAQQFTDQYFSIVNIKNPVLDRTETHALVDSVFASDHYPNSAEHALVLVVCALGAITQKYPDLAMSPSDMANSTGMALFRQAQVMLVTVLTETGLTQCRCCFLVGTFFMTILRPLEAWRMFLQSLSMCQLSDLGMQNSDDNHKASAQPSTPVESLYWSAWKSEREVRIELDPPDFGMTFNRFPPAFRCLSMKSDQQNIEDWYFYLSEISIWRIETVARHKLESLISARYSRRKPQQDVLDLLADFADDVASQVSAWKHSLSPAVSLTADEVTLPSPSASSSSFSPSSSATILQKGFSVYKFVLRGRTTYVHELITWPFVYSCLHGLTSQASHWKWFERGLAYHLDRLIINRPGFYYRHHGTWLMLRSSARSASILLAAAGTASCRSALPQGWQELVSATLDMLHFWSDSLENIKGITVQLQKMYDLTTARQAA